MCIELRDVTIPVNVKSIGRAVFSGCTSLVEINVNLENEYYKSIDGNLYSKDGSVLHSYAYGKTATSFKIPSCVKIIGSLTFDSCKNLTQVIIPSGVEKIESAAFSSCTSLEKIILPNTIEYIDSMAFSYCYSLTEIFIQGVTTVIREYAFYKCSKLKIYCEAVEKPVGWDTYWNYIEGDIRYDIFAPTKWDYK